MQRDRQAFLPLLAKKEHISDTEMIQLRDLVIKYEGVKQAYTMAQQRTELATAGLQKLPAGAARDDLIRLTEKSLRFMRQSQDFFTFTIVRTRYLKSNFHLRKIS